MPPTLETLSDASVYAFAIPAKRIESAEDVAHFLASRAYGDISRFILQLNRSVCPRLSSASGPPTAHPTNGQPADIPPVQRLRELLHSIAGYITEAPPDPGPRRFGNTSFRTWHSLLAGRAPLLLSEFLATQTPLLQRAVNRSGQEQTSDGQDKVTALDELQAYFIGAFGSPQRLDYGTGHELSFIAFIGCLWKLGVFQGYGSVDHVSRSIALGVMERYLEVIRQLIQTFTLEPAGSHGVWGLDDHSFLPYILGSAQLAPSISEDQPMPVQGSATEAPAPGDIVRPDVVKSLRASNMYFSAIGFVNDVKSGPFWEHSPVLFDISGVRDGWAKINKGMIKMYNAEVLSKFPVVQHFPFGSLFSWDFDPDAIVHSTNRRGPGEPNPATAAAPAPWTQPSSTTRPVRSDVPSSRIPSAYRLAANGKQIINMADTTTENSISGFISNNRVPKPVAQDTAPDVGHAAGIL